MRVGIFAPMLGREAAGPGTYEEHLIGALARADPDSTFHVWCSEEGAGLLPSALENLVVHPWRAALRLPSVAVAMPWQVRGLNLDLMHATFVPPPYSPIDYVFTVHDLSPLLHPEFYKPHLRRRLSYFIKRGIAQARAVVCISETTRAHVVERFGVAEDRLTVAYHGVDARFCPGDTALARARVSEEFGIEGRYILYLGKIETRKNIKRLLQAFSIFRGTAHKDVKLVLAGKRHWGMDDIDAAIMDLGLSAAVIETGYVADELVPVLYRGAELMVFPSLWEGFGLPLIEAMSCGTPVATSNASCLPEIAGGAALEFDPLDPDAMAATMATVFDDPQVAVTMRKRGFARARDFTWANSATATLTAYQRTFDLNRA